MKRSIIKYTFWAAASLFTMSSCSSDWLETSPTSSASGDEMLSNVENAKLAINGLCRIMINQHAAYRQGFNGEGTINMYYGEYEGQDLNYPYMSPGWAALMNGTMNENNSSIYDTYPWYYYYLIIGNANSIIAKIDNATGDEATRQFIKAEALTFRAYAFFRLSQIYCVDWKNSDKGAAKGIVLRTDESQGDQALATLGETYTQVYKDLDDAIALYQQSGLTRNAVYSTAKDAVCFPDLSVAYVIYARAALTKQDYTKALDYASLAEEGHPLMSNTDYYSGFVASNKEWIWGVYNDTNETIYYWGWQVMMACNGYYATKNGINVCINKSLVESFPDTDIRKGLFLTEKTFLPEGKTFADVGGNEESNSAFTDETAYNKANEYTKKTIPAATEQTYAYANLKFQAAGMPGIGEIPIIRSSEMELIKAEAAYFLGKTSDAQNALIALNKTSGRDVSYTCDKTGDALLKEIKQYRRLELWGEGFSWFDCKRWNDPVVRTGFDDGGNFFGSVAGTYGADDSGKFDATNRFWKWILPAKETDYNTAVK